MKRFSFFLAPVSNVVPHKTVEMEQIYNVIRATIIVPLPKSCAA